MPDDLHEQAPPGPGPERPARGPMEGPAETDPVTPSDETPPLPDEGPGSAGLERLRNALLRPSRAQVGVGLLLAVLGFAAVTQVRTNTTDNSYAQARRIRQWAQGGVVLLTPALKWTKGRYAKAYHSYINQPEQRDLLQSRRTAIEPIFDLVAKALGTTGRQKQLPVQRLANVRPCLALATLTVQVAMIANSIWGLPLRNISPLVTAFT